MASSRTASMSRRSRSSPPSRRNAAKYCAGSRTSGSKRPASRSCPAEKPLFPFATIFLSPLPWALFADERLHHPDVVHRMHVTVRVGLLIGPHVRLAVGKCLTGGGAVGWCCEIRFRERADLPTRELPESEGGVEYGHLPLRGVGVG